MHHLFFFSVFSSCFVFLFFVCLAATQSDFRSPATGKARLSQFAHVPLALFLRQIVSSLAFLPRRIQHGSYSLSVARNDLQLPIHCASNSVFN